MLDGITRAAFKGGRAQVKRRYRPDAYERVHQNVVRAVQAHLQYPDTKIIRTTEVRLIVFLSACGATARSSTPTTAIGYFARACGRILSARASIPE